MTNRSENLFNPKSEERRRPEAKPEAPGKKGYQSNIRANPGLKEQMANQQPHYYINKQQKSANNLNQTYSSSINTNS